MGEKFGYIDHSGKLVIPARFDAALDFDGGLALVEVHVCGDSDRAPRTGKCMKGRTDVAGYVDRQGKYVVAPSTRK